MPEALALEPHRPSSIAFPLIAAIADAFRLQETGGPFGKVVVEY